MKKTTELGGANMRLIKTYSGGKDSEFNIGRFYRSDTRKLNALRLYYDFPANSRELLNDALDGRHSLFAVLKKGKRVIGYMIYEFPCVGNDSNLWLFRIPQRITPEGFAGVLGIVSNYCTNILGTESHSNIHLFVKTKEDGV